MTFDPNSPNASQSPGLFPAQNSANLTRLKTIINADHVFNDTAQDDDGCHRQMTLVARDDPVSLPAGTNGILYSKLDADSRAQIYFYNGDSVQTMTPQTMRIVGSQSVGAGATVTIYADPGFRYCGLGWALIQGLNGLKMYDILRMGGNNLNLLDSSGTLPPTLSFSGNNLQITNPSAGTLTLQWSLIINRIS